MGIQKESLVLIIQADAAFAIDLTLFSSTSLGYTTLYARPILVFQDLPGKSLPYC
jgi:hypothetical protein